ncbi:MULTISPECIES: DUF397 domain-containing protein [unclassified Streptomyces]|uniref:DUF397 domain-containing protein n=1 Tax=unclassified Streptomyces TaxID=2593676 RepID=UPI00332FCDA3
MNPDLNSSWVRSSYSGSSGGQCVEWAPEFASAHGVVLVRDSKAGNGPVLRMSPRIWAGLIALARGSSR